MKEEACQRSALHWLGLLVGAVLQPLKSFIVPRNTAFRAASHRNTSANQNDTVNSGKPNSDRLVWSHTGVYEGVLDEFITERLDLGNRPAGYNNTGYLKHQTRTGPKR